MGTSQSSKGSKNKSPLVPSWADATPTPPMSPQRFRGFRGAIGQYVKSGNLTDLNKALGHYSRSASGGSAIASKRFKPHYQVGGNLFDILQKKSITVNNVVINLQSWVGKSTDEVIDYLSNTLSKESGGDSEKIRYALNEALSQALDGITQFSFDSITDEVLISILINYLVECVFIQVIHEAGDSWKKSTNTQTPIQAENAMHELIKVVVDQKMCAKFATGINLLSAADILEVQQNTILDVWHEWEAF